MQDFLNQLNNSQLAAVTYCDGPQLVIAGAGSGKTRVLTYKIAYLLRNGMAPWNVLALTFTNKAANEMKERIGSLVGGDLARYINMGTFHSVFYRILRTEIDKIGFRPNFTIYDESDSRNLVGSIIKEMNLDDSKYKPSQVLNQISYAKSNLMGYDGFLNDRDDAQRKVGYIYKEYERRCFTANAMDFDDLLVMTYRLFKNNPDVLAEYAERFKYVLVDEYQDTNYAQQRIIELLYQKNPLVCLVGDDAQSIYAFRGANIDYMLDFPRNNNFKIFKLEQNYRSTQNIVAAANSLIKHNERQIYKDVFSDNDKGDKLKLKATYSDREEACVVCNEIVKLRAREHCRYCDFAILYRTNAQSRVFEEELIRQSIPYKIYGGLNFYQRKEIKDVIAYMRLAVNPHDEEAMRRVINYPARGIGATTLSKLAEAAHTRDVSMWDVLLSMASYDLKISTRTRNQIDVFRRLIEEFIERSQTEDVYKFGCALVEKSGIKGELYSSSSPEDVSRQQNLEELIGAMDEFVNKRLEQGIDSVLVSDFLQEVALLTDNDSDEDDDNKVSLMTIHSAKGLEFATVFVVGLEENIIPSLRSSSTLREIEEERRLLYVAITRAQRHCRLSYAKSRYRYGKLEYSRPSRFIGNIDMNYIDIDDRTLNKASFATRRAEAMNIPERPRHTEISTVKPSSAVLRPIAATAKSTEKTTTRESDDLFNIKVGDTIEHQRFGVGKITAIEGVDENTKATVEFVNAGRKQLLLKFAKFKVIG